MEHIRTRTLGRLLHRRFPGIGLGVQPYGFIAGTVQIEGVPTRRRVRCIERKTGNFIAETWSAADGSYRFDDLVVGRQYIIVAMDYDLQYNAVVADNVLPALGEPAVEPPMEEPEAALVGPINFNVRYEFNSDTVILTWHNVNWHLDDTRVYRDTAPMDPENLPLALDEISPLGRRYVDDSFIDGQTYYWRVAFERYGQTVVSDELVTENTGSNPFEGAAVGSPMFGGFFTAIMFDEVGARYGLITAPFAGGSQGSSTVNWQTAMDWCEALDLNGFDDWRLATLDERIMEYRAYKPGTGSNNTGSGATDRVDPPLGNYTASDPSQTSLPDWQDGGSEAFIASTYWSATEAGTIAWIVNFNNGFQLTNSKPGLNRVRAVRRVYF